MGQLLGRERRLANTSLHNAGAVHWYRVTPGALPVSFYSTYGATAGAEIGSALALSGRTLLLGGPGWTVNGVPRGIVGEFRYNGSAWQHFHSWQAPANSQTGFGIEVAVGDVWMAMGSRSSLPGTSALDSVFRVRRHDPQTALDAWWNARQPGTALPALDSDADGDGWSLVDEYTWNLNPLAADSRAFPGGFAPAFPYSIDFTAPAGDPRLRARVLGSGDLVNWQPSPLPPSVLGTTGGRTRWRQSFPHEPRQCFRMESLYRR